MAGGNFGAPPKPALVRSNDAASSLAAVARIASFGSGDSAIPGSGVSRSAKALSIAAAEASTSARRVRQASVTASNTIGKDGRPCIGCGGKYVPAWNARPS